MIVRIDHSHIILLYKAFLPETPACYEHLTVANIMLQESLMCFVANPVCLFLALVDSIMFPRLSRTDMAVDEGDTVRMPGEDPTDCYHDTTPYPYMDRRFKIEEEIFTVVNVREVEDEPDLVLVDIFSSQIPTTFHKR